MVTVFDILEEAGSPWIIMELVRGRYLEQVIAEDGPLPPRHAAALGGGLVSALEAAHAAGVLHRDVKPANVLMSGDGRAVLTDFGIATFAADPGITLAGMVVGTPGFTAPERIRGGSATPASTCGRWARRCTRRWRAAGRSSGPAAGGRGRGGGGRGTAPGAIGRTTGAGHRGAAQPGPGPPAGAAGASALLADAVAAGTAARRVAAPSQGYEQPRLQQPGPGQPGPGQPELQPRITGPGSRALGQYGYLNPARGAGPAAVCPRPVIGAASTTGRPGLGRPAGRGMVWWGRAGPLEGARGPFGPYALYRA